MANAEKSAAVAEIVDAFRGSTAAVLTEYRGLTVAQLKELRRSLAGHATYAVVKNTLTTIAMRDAGLPEVSGRLTGPTAIAFVTGDPVTVAKGLRDFARTHPLLVVKGGVMDGRPLSADEVRHLADLQSREVLLAQLAGAMTASLAQAAALFTAPLSQLARVTAALAAKAAEDPRLLAAGTESGSADTDPEVAPPAAVDDVVEAAPPAVSDADAADESPAASDGDVEVGLTAAPDAEAEVSPPSDTDLPH